jgi:DNA-binding transcriptional regulator LsrR (DeoR family)
MSGLSAERPSEVVLAARVARQFYLEGVSKVDIADSLGISRFRVARLLESARETGMVRIEIGLPGGTLDAGLSAELCSAFGLRHAFVFNFPDDDEPALRRRLGEAAGQALVDLISPGDVLGMSWSRTLSGLAAAMTQLPPCPIVQLTGAVPPPDGRDLLDLVRSVARIGGGPALLRADDHGRCPVGGCDPTASGHRWRLRACPVRDDGLGRDRRLGAGPVDDL